MMQIVIVMGDSSLYSNSFRITSLEDAGLKDGPSYASQAAAAASSDVTVNAYIG
ncbi:hypothetical protein ACRALDRAFT_1093570 [Sodiomyces alcalophilus JCM 7366]|uniref:uncharacterized protein n=1 Tax=Sodiomyces alcalophilus JCM 7366 TaxID=591952 RepID=UPI0039B56591